MPVMEKATTYTPLPPPPLPQFYSSKAQRKHQPSTLNNHGDTAADRDILAINEVAGVDGAYDIKPRDSRLGHSPSMPLIAMQPLNSSPQDVPPLAIYHICRICLRPRSPRYHREHPIPLEGVPPPPGICRRCRVTKVIDTKTVDLVYEGRSNEVKLGFFTPFMREEDILSQEEVKKMKADQLVRGRTTSEVIIEKSDRHRKKSFSRVRSRSGRRSDSRNDVKSRVIYVKVDDESGGNSSEANSGADIDDRKVTFRSSQEAIEAFNTTPPTSHVERTSQTSMQVEHTEQDPLPSQGRSVPATVSTKSSSHASQAGSESTARASARLTVPPAGPTASEVGRIVRGELDRYAEAFKKQQWAESDIRKISKEEVEKYRAAERKIEAHHDPFAHGRLVPIVPVERRIEVEKDAPAVTPWSQSTNEGNPQSKVSDHDWQQTKVTVTSPARAHGPKQSTGAIQPDGKSKDHKSEAHISSVRQTDRGDVHSHVRQASWDFTQAKAGSTKASVKYNRPDHSDHRSDTAQDGVLPEGKGFEERQSRSQHGTRKSRWHREISVERQYSVRSGKEPTQRPERQQAAKDASKRATREAYSDPPSVKLREVYDDVPESNPPRWSSKAEPYVVGSTPASQVDKHNMIEVIEEVELPPRPCIASHRRSENAEDTRAESKRSRQQGYEREVDVRYVRVNKNGDTNRHSRSDDETWSSGTSLGDRGTRATLHTVRDRPREQEEASQKSGSTKRLGLEMSGALPEPEESNAAQDKQSEYQSDKTRWADDDSHHNGAAEMSSRAGRSQTRHALPYPEDRTADGNSSARDRRRYRAASRRSERHSNSDVEYIYTERVVTPADRPRGWRPPKLKVIEEEEWYLNGSPSRGLSPQ